MALGDNPRDGAVVRCKRLKKGTGVFTWEANIRHAVPLKRLVQRALTPWGSYEGWEPKSQ
jgi:hypothetical protein